MNRLSIKEGKNALFWFCLALGIVMVAMTTVKFFLPEIKLPDGLRLFYPIILAAYVMVKEVCRWGGEPASSRLGEVLVFLWAGAFVLLSISEFVLGLLGLNQKRFIVPEEMVETCVEVILIYACSEVSKKLFLLKNPKNKTTNSSG